ncbi:MAG: plasmid pRiA4b ORF-3 family protein, partial [Anaerolineales bacterium]|nr:plasmid pRiA4b ORF-3 family protein [Anaerolineales bacterium]
IWRRIHVYQHVTFVNLHLTLQVVMGWLHSHLHLFEVQETLITDNETLAEWSSKGVDEVDARLMDHVAEIGSLFRYEYDFGDSWNHELVLEERLPLESGRRYPYCVEGGGACPPEDVGGTFGFEAFREAMANPRHEAHASYRTWYGGPFKPHAFDAARVNRHLQRGYTWRNYLVVPALATRPSFTPKAAEQWALIPKKAQQQLLTSTYCPHCQGTTTLVDYSGRYVKGDVLLEGRCGRCGQHTKRLVEIG